LNEGLFLLLRLTRKRLSFRKKKEKKGKKKKVLLVPVKRRYSPRTPPAPGKRYQASLSSSKLLNREKGKEKKTWKRVTGTARTGERAELIRLHVLEKGRRGKNREPRKLIRTRVMNNLTIQRKGKGKQRTIPFKKSKERKRGQEAVSGRDKSRLSVFVTKGGERDYGNTRRTHTRPVGTEEVEFPFLRSESTKGR